MDLYRLIQILFLYSFETHPFNNMCAEYRIQCIFDITLAGVQAITWH